MQLPLMLFFVFSISGEIENDHSLDQFKRDLQSFISGAQYDWSQQMPIKRFGGNTILSTELKGFMTDPESQINYYWKEKLIVDSEEQFYYNIKSNLIYDAINDAVYSVDDFGELFHRRREILLNN
jgi:hypothetical protein